MFGYTEDTYSLISSQTIVRDGVNVQLDVRRPRLSEQRTALLELSEQLTALLEDPTVKAGYRTRLERELEAYAGRPDYLVLVREGNPTYLMYAQAQPIGVVQHNKESAMQRLNQDLAILMARSDVDLKTLQWTELINNDTGYYHDGGIAMY